MSARSELVYDVREDDFEERVLRASSARPVIVDFWAPWCAPCRMLSPVLEKVVTSFGGGVVLAKANVEEVPGLARQYAISSIPAVKVFRAGRIAAEFVGMRGEAEVREMLSRVVPSEADEIVASAGTLAGAGKIDEAESFYREALRKHEGHPGALLGLALIAMGKGDVAAAGEAASRIEPGAAEHQEAESILARVEFARLCTEMGGHTAASEQLAEAPDDLGALYAQASCLAAAQKYEDALEHFMRIVERDKSYRGGAAKDAMLRIFTVVDKRSALAVEYRSRLARALY